MDEFTTSMHSNFRDAWWRRGGEGVGGAITWEREILSSLPWKSCEIAISPPTWTVIIFDLYYSSLNSK